jgi:hypothetical protein
MRLMSGLFVLSLIVLGGCQNSFKLRYAAIPQPKGAELYADYTQLQEAVIFQVDTDGKRLEDIYIQTAEGAAARPVVVNNAPFHQSAVLGTGIGGGARHVGGGVGLGFPVGPKEAHGLSTARFQMRAIGAPPWTLHVKVSDTPEAVFPGVGGPPTAQK